MYLTIDLAAWDDIRDVSMLLLKFRRDGWDIERDGYGSGVVRLYHPDIRTERQARVRLAVLGLTASRFGFVVDGPVIV